MGRDKLESKMLDRITGDKITPKHIKDSTDITYMISMNNLPSPIRNNVDKFISQVPVKSHMCWFNSHNLSLSTKEIDVVNGWYGIKSNVTDIKDLPWDNSQWMGEKYLCIWDEGDDSYKDIFELETGIIWVRHSWNKYKNIHFDLTSELSDKMKDEWVFYKGHENVFNNEINFSPMISEVTQSVIDNHLFEYSGYEVLNRKRIQNFTPIHPMY
jgi:hypothetical protein